MKDLIKRISISAISGSLLGYLVFLFVNNATIVEAQYANVNFLYYIILGIVFFYLFLFFGIYPIYIKLTKATLFTAGIALIVIGNTVLVNNGETGVYLGDICKVLGVVLAVVAWTNLLITNKVKKQKEESKIEIIEV